MKITGIEIGEYRQFKNIKFDFTYPKGHPKEGKPLEKVCFIGQSGTGKTTLLNIIWNFFTILDDGYQLNDSEPVFGSRSSYQLFANEIVLKLREDKDITFSAKELGYHNTKDKNSLFSSVFNWLYSYNIHRSLDKYEKNCLYIYDSAANEAESFLQNRSNDENARKYIITEDEIKKNKEKKESFFNLINRSHALSMGYYEPDLFWNYIFSDIDIYDQELKKIALDMIQKSGSFSAERLVSKLNDWQEKNPNPRIELANHCLNPILKKLYLEVDTVGTEAPVVIKSKKGRQIAGYLLSTGTKQMLSTAIPIFKTKITNGVILLDEPERSLFPDIQRDLTAHYTSLAPTAQFFFATHSPIIASAFEPCERFILFFDENGEVNYHNGVAPEGDDPNDILKQDFGMEYLMLQKGLEEYERYRQLGMQIRNEKSESRKNELIAERLELGNRYNF